MNTKQLDIAECKEIGDSQQGRLPFRQEQALRQSDRMCANCPPGVTFIEQVTARGAEAAWGKTFSHPARTTSTVR